MKYFPLNAIITSDINLTEYYNEHLFSAYYLSACITWDEFIVFINHSKKFDKVIFFDINVNELAVLIEKSFTEIPFNQVERPYFLKKINNTKKMTEKIFEILMS